MSSDAATIEPGRPAVLRRGTVLTMNDAHDVLHDADVLVVDDKIAGVGPGLRLRRARTRSTPPTASSCRG